MMRSAARRLRILLVALPWLLAMACEQPNHAFRPLTEVSPCAEEHECPTSCRKLEGGLCDIRDRGCQQRLLEAVQCVWGAEAEPPTVRVMEVEEALDELLGAESEDEGDELRLGPWDRAYVMLGLREPGTSSGQATRDDLRENLGAFYRAESHDVVVLDRQQNDGPSDADMSVLAHEMVHAVQYGSSHGDALELADDDPRLYDLDWLMARRMAIEGDATIHEDLAWSLLRGVPLSEEGQRDRFRWRLAQAQRAVFEAPSPITSRWLLAYPVGAALLWERWLAGEPATVRAQGELPQRVSGWIGDHDPRGDMRCDAPDAPPGYRDFSVAEVGADVLFAFWSRVHSHQDSPAPLHPTWLDSGELVRSRLRLYTSKYATDGDGAVALGWRLRFRSRWVAEAFLDDVWQAGEVDASLDGSEVLLTAVEEGSALERFGFTVVDEGSALERIDFECPEFLSLAERLDRLEAALGQRKGRGARRVPPPPVPPQVMLH